MSKFFQRLERQDLTVLLFIICFVGLLYSKVLLSLGLIALLPLSLLDIQWLPTFSIRPRQKLGVLFQVYRSHPPYWAIGLMLLVVLATALYAGTSDYWMDRVRIKAPLLLAPILLALIPPISKRQLQTWMLGIIGIGVVSLTGFLINYFIHADEIIEGLKMGQAIPVIISHIRYNLLIVFCMSCALWLCYEGAPNRNWQIFSGAAAVFFLIGLHILSVRSGLLAAYLVLLLALLYMVIDSKKYWLGVAGLLALILIPMIAIKTSPALEARMGYAKYDLEQYFKGNAGDNSDGERIRSLKIGWETFRENLWLGTGVAKFRSTIREKYSRLYPDQLETKLPHNQYLSVIASTGIVGGCITFFGFLLPLFYRRQFTFYPMAALYLIIMTSMLFENTLETTVGLNLFLLPVLMLLNYLSGRPTKQ